MSASLESAATEAAIGDRIKAARKDAGLNQSALAERVGVSQPAVANWESGVHDPRRLMIAKIAEALGVAPEWLASGARSASEADKHPAAAYIRRAVLHTPVIPLAEAARALDGDSFDPHRVALDYIPVTTNAERLFAFFADDEAVNLAFPRNTLVVIDYDDRLPADGVFCLASVDDALHLRRWRDSPPRLEAASMKQDAFSPIPAETAIIIGCARVSIRFH